MTPLFAALKVTASELGIPTGASNLGDGLYSIVNLLFGLIGGLSILALIYGGIQLSMSQGDPGGIAKAKNTILYAIVGMIVAGSASMIVWFITHNIGSGGESLR